MKILVIDDNPDIRNLIQMILKPHEFDVLLADSGSRGLEILETREVDLIILDIVMPEMDGFTVCEKIKNNSDLCDIPVIFLSIQDETPSLVKGLKLGAVDYISKPFHSDEFIARINVHLDLYKNKKLLQEKLEENKQLIHVLAHDLKNPIGCALSMMELIDEDPEDAAEYSEYARSALEQGLQIIDLIKDFMAVKEKKMTLKLNRLNLAQLIGNSLNTLKNQFSDKNISVNVSVDSTLFVVVDEVSFVNSVLNNLMTNAIKFSFKGSAIDIIADQNQDLVSLSIIDKGIGMPKKIENDIFNIEKSISRPGTEGEVGTGFGMPLVKKFVEAYGGTIQIISKEKSADENDHGTKAVVTLPAK